MQGTDAEEASIEAPRTGVVERAGTRRENEAEARPCHGVCSEAVRPRSVRWDCGSALRELKG